MGRNKNLRKAIAGQQKVVEGHEAKVREERKNSQPSEEYIANWEREIEVAKARVAHLMRRLKREW
jgi:hypothetical protein